MALQAHIGFSDAYADFLRTQNGFSLYKMELRATLPPIFSPASGQRKPRQLPRAAQLCAQDPHYDLSPIRPNFCWPTGLSIGHDPAGNPFVEVLHGQHKGKIGSLDHDLFLGADLQSSSAIWSWSILRHSASPIRPMHCAIQLGLIWFHARDLNPLRPLHSLRRRFLGLCGGRAQNLRHLGQSRPCFIASRLLPCPHLF
jgi:hypothetical protein